MQILGAAGKSGAGKTTLIDHVARMLVDSDYGMPRRLRFSEGPQKLAEMERDLRKAQEDERAGIGPRTEILVLIDNVRFIEEVDLVHRWGGRVIFVCADGRLRDLRSAKRRVESERMANSYTEGRSSELFDFAITNHHDRDRFLVEVEKFMYMFFGGDASYEAGLI